MLTEDELAEIEATCDEPCSARDDVPVSTETVGPRGTQYVEPADARRWLAARGVAGFR